MTDVTWMTEAAANEVTGLEGRVAIVTGASAGAGGAGVSNGRAAAIVLGMRGVKVVCVGRREAELHTTVEMVNAQGGDAIAVAADVTVEADCARVVARAVDAYGRVDYLDNNVGFGEIGNVVDMPLSDWRMHWQVNVESTILMSKYAIPAMIDTAGCGSIVNIGSLRAIRPLERTAYATTKGAIMALTQAMAVDHGRDGIRVNCIVLGPVFNPSMIGAVTAEQRELRKNASALGIEGTAWDNANLVAFLMSDHARFLTGQCIALDGGVSLVSPRR